MPCLIRGKLYTVGIHCSFKSYCSACFEISRRRRKYMFFFCNPQKKREKQGKNKTDIHSTQEKVYDEENDVQVPSICVFFCDSHLYT